MSSDYARVRDMLESGPFPQGSPAVVHELISQAMGYVWGWQDGGASPKDSGVAWNFGYAYGVHAAEYATGKRHSRMCIQDAFKSWCESGEIKNRFAVKVAS